MLRGRMAAASAAADPGSVPAAARRSRSTCSCATSRRSSARVARVPDLDAVPGAVADYLAAQNLPSRLVMAPHPELRAIPWSARPLLDDPRGPRGGVRHGQRAARLRRHRRNRHADAAVARRERPTTLNLLPDTEIVVLRASRLVGAYEEAWDLLRPSSASMPRNVMLVTGPSRSADIEQTLELGAHGPRRLHVVLVEDAAA